MLPGHDSFMSRNPLNTITCTHVMTKMHVSTLHATKQFIKSAMWPSDHAGHTSSMDGVYHQIMRATVVMYTSFHLCVTGRLVFCQHWSVGPQDKWLCLPFLLEPPASGSSIR